MGFYKKIKYFLVHTLLYTNKRAQRLIEEGAIEVDGIVIPENCVLPEQAEVKVNGKTVLQKKKYIYLKFYKPRGFQSSLNNEVKDNLSEFFKDYKNLAIAGRLDKESEGLLLLSDDGKWVESLCNPKFEKEKEYVVELNSAPGEDFVEKIESGVLIGGTYLTKPCYCTHIDERVIKVVLKEGKNRQIRKMCKTLNREVLTLQRIRIANIKIGEMTPSEIQHLDNTEISII